MGAVIDFPIRDVSGQWVRCLFVVFSAFSMRDGSGRYEGIPGGYYRDFPMRDGSGSVFVESVTEVIRFFANTNEAARVSGRSRCHAGVFYRGKILEKID